MAKKVITVWTAFAAPAAAQPGKPVNPIRTLNTRAWTPKVTRTITRYSDACLAVSVRAQPNVHFLFSRKWSMTAGGYATRNDRSAPSQ